MVYEQVHEFNHVARLEDHNIKNNNTTAGMEMFFFIVTHLICVCI